MNMFVRRYSEACSSKNELDQLAAPVTVGKGTKSVPRFNKKSTLSPTSLVPPVPPSRLPTTLGPSATAETGSRIKTRGREFQEAGTNHSTSSSCTDPRREQTRQADSHGPSAWSHADANFIERSVITQNTDQSALGTDSQVGFPSGPAAKNSSAYQEGGLQLQKDSGVALRLQQQEENTSALSMKRSGSFEITSQREAKIAKYDGMHALFCSSCLLVKAERIQCKEGHVICKQCVEMVIFETISLDRTNLKCPATRCSEDISIESLSPLEPNLLVELAKTHMRKKENLASQTLIQCPKCLFPAEIDKDHIFFKCTGEDCHVQTCRYCFASKASTDLPNIDRSDISSDKSSEDRSDNSCCVLQECDQTRSAVPSAGPADAELVVDKEEEMTLKCPAAPYTDKSCTDVQAASQKILLQPEEPSLRQPTKPERASERSQSQTINRPEKPKSLSRAKPQNGKQARPSQRTQTPPVKSSHRVPAKPLPASQTVSKPRLEFVAGPSTRSCGSTPVTASEGVTGKTSVKSRLVRNKKWKKNKNWSQISTVTNNTSSSETPQRMFAPVVPGEPISELYSYSSNSGTIHENESNQKLVSKVSEHGWVEACVKSFNPRGHTQTHHPHTLTKPALPLLQSPDPTNPQSTPACWTGMSPVVPHLCTTIPLASVEARGVIDLLKPYNVEITKVVRIQNTALWRLYSETKLKFSFSSTVSGTREWFEMRKLKQDLLLPLTKYGWDERIPGLRFKASPDNQEPMVPPVVVTQCLSVDSSDRDKGATPPPSWRDSSASAVHASTKQSRSSLFCGLVAYPSYIAF